MKLLLTFFSIFLVMLSLLAQNELVSENYPFKNLYEWQGVGTIITLSDPDERQRDYNIWLLNTSGEVQWREKFYPKLSNPFPIIGHNSSYIYFLDNIKPENHKINYHQINMSGSVKSTQLELLSIVKKAGFNSTEDLVMVDIINTPGALVFQFEFNDKAQKRKDQFFVFLTHHNHRTYAVKGLSVSYDGLKSGLEGELRYAGSDAETIYFSRYIKRSNDHTLEFVPYSAKGEEKLVQVFTLSDYAFANSQSDWVNYRGEFHLNGANRPACASGGFYLDKRFYCVGFDEEMTSFALSTFNEKGKQEVMKEVKLQTYKKIKGTPTLWIGEFKQGLFVGFNVMDDHHHIYFSGDVVKKVELNQSDYDLIRTNPSLLETGIRPGIFVHFYNDGYFRLHSEGLGSTKLLKIEN